jgi:tetratricopeptide (TPR) repeat protein
MPRVLGVLALLGFALAAAAAPAAAQGPLARTYAAHGSSALDAGDFADAIREFSVALDLYPSYVDAYVGRAVALIAQDRLLESWGDLKTAKRYEEDAARKAAVDELMKGIEVAARLASYRTFLASAQRDAEAVQVADWTGRFRATLYAFPAGDGTALGFAPEDVLKKYARELRALGRQTEASQTEAIADAYLGHRLESWRRQQEQYEKEQ